MGTEAGAASPRPAEASRRAWLGRPAPLGLACALAAAGLLLSYLLRNQCATHPWVDAFQYRHLCYNDIQPLFHARGVDRGLVPYTAVTVEYPVLIGTFMYVTGRLLALLLHVGLAAGYTDPSYFELTALLLWPFSFVVTLLLRPRVPASRLMLWAIGTPTIFYTFLNWDILAVAPLVWGLVEVERRRWGWAGFALALGASAKLFPGFAVPGAFLAAMAARDRRGGVRLLNGFGVGVLLANVPWMIASFSGWMAVWKFHADRFPDLGTVWYWLAQLGNTYVHGSPWWNSVTGGWGELAGTAGLGVFGLVSLLILWVGWRRRDEPGGYPVAAVTLAIVVSFMVVAKVHSPQYALWVIPLLAMVDVPWRQVVAYLASDAVLYVSGWYWYTTPHPFTPPASMAEKIFVLAVFARCFVLVVIAVYAARHGRRRWPVAAEGEGLQSGEAREKGPFRKHFFPVFKNDPDSVGTAPYSGSPDGRPTQPKVRCTAAPPCSLPGSLPDHRKSLRRQYA